MNRSTFFIIIAIIGFLFGCFLLLVPTKGAELFGWTSTPEITLLFRTIGGFIISIAVLNWLVRNEIDSYTLKAVLILNLLSHIIAMIIDTNGILDEILQFKNLAGGYVIHLFVAGGSIVYLNKLNKKV
jgi:hypothetical protein